MKRRTWLLVALLALGLADEGCGSGACRQTPCLPGIPLLASTCKCVANDDAGLSSDAQANPTD
jgi:hypothetical protein